MVMSNTQLNTFFDKLQTSIDTKTIVKVLLTNKKDKTSDLKKLIITAIELKQGYSLNIVYRHNTKDITKNYEVAQGIELIRKSLENDFHNAELVATMENTTYVILPNGKPKLKTTPSQSIISTPLAHNRIKERLIETHQNIYLRELNITNTNWEVRREMSDKFKQINQYIELLAPEIKELNLPENYHVADMGSGKGYLTFALYDFLTNNLHHKVKMSGVEYREELVTICNEIAYKANFKKLNFKQGTIETTELEKIDILIALHACDTATDDAIYRGIANNAALIVCAPCCHKQIRKSFNVTNELKEVTKFGILKERQAEIITDTIRALLLEAYGYKTKVFEFISLEHTPKNVMIVGRKTRKSNPDKDKILANIQAIKQTFGIEKHYLETLLGI
jgi:hypothetical protein